MSVQSPFNFQTAQSSRLPAFRLLIDNWGNRGTGADATSLGYGLLPGQTINSAYAIAIGPDSTVDRAVIQFQNIINTTASLTPLPETFTPRNMQMVSKDQPANSLTGNLAVRCSNVNFYTDTYVPDGSAASANKPFGGTEPLFESPLLELYFYLRDVLSNFQPLKRSPMFRRFQLDATAHIGAGEQLMAIYPVFGRKSFTVHARGTGDVSGSIRVGAISYSFQGSPFPSVANTEVTLAAPVFDATVGHQCAVAQSLNAQYLALYYTANAGVGGFVEGHMLADDDGSCCGVFQIQDVGA